MAGSANYVGAAYLSSAAATRVGAGLVTLGVAGSIYPLLAAKLTEVTYLLLADERGALTSAGLKIVREHVNEYRALLLGPGLGREQKTGDFVRELLSLKTVSESAPIGLRARRDPLPARKKASACPGW